MISPQPGRIFIRCECCGGVFSRCNWMPHCNNFSNRPLSNIRIKATGETLTECFGDDLSRSMDYVIRHGSFPGPWLKTQNKRSAPPPSDHQPVVKKPTIRIRMLPPKRVKKDKAAARGNAPPGFVMEAPPVRPVVPHRVLRMCTPPPALAPPPARVLQSFARCCRPRVRPAFSLRLCRAERLHLQWHAPLAHQDPKTTH